MFKEIWSNMGPLRQRKKEEQAAPDAFVTFVDHVMF